MFDLDRLEPTASSEIEALWAMPVRDDAVLVAGQRDVSLLSVRDLSVLETIEAGAAVRSMAVDPNRRHGVGDPW